MCDRDKEDEENLKDSGSASRSWSVVACGDLVGLNAWTTLTMFLKNLQSQNTPHPQLPPTSATSTLTFCEGVVAGFGRDSKSQQLVAFKKTFVYFQTFKPSKNFCKFQIFSFGRACLLACQSHIKLNLNL